MATRTVGKNPGSRLDAGNRILEATKMIDTKPVKSRLVVFTTAHKEFVAADQDVGKGETAFRTQQTRVAEADVEQDAAVDSLAAALAVEGESRTSPFDSLGFGTPTAIKKLGYGNEAKEATRLARAVAKKKGRSKPTLAAAKRLEQAARNVQKEIGPLEKLASAREAAVSRRDVAGQIWENAYAALKRGARAAEDDGAVGLYNAFFSGERARRKSGATVKKSVEPSDSTDASGES